MVKHRKHKKLRIKLSFSSDSNSSSEDEWEATAHQLALALSAALQATTMAPVSTLAASLAVDAAEPSQPSRHVFADTCFFYMFEFFLVHVCPRGCFCHCKLAIHSKMLLLHGWKDATFLHGFRCICGNLAVMTNA